MTAVVSRAVRSIQGAQFGEAVEQSPCFTANSTSPDDVSLLVAARNTSLRCQQCPGDDCPAEESLETASDHAEHQPSDAMVEQCSEPPPARTALSFLTKRVMSVLGENGVIGPEDESLSERIARRHKQAKPQKASHTRYEEEIDPTARERLRLFVTGHFFERMVACIILLNTLVIGWTTDWQMKHHHEPQGTVSRTFNNVFTSIFTVELLLRMLAELRLFFSCENPNLKWNMIDTLIVATSLTESVMAELGMDMMDLSMLRMLRNVRLVRVMRLVRTMPLFADLRAMVAGVVSSLSSLFWATFVLALLIYLYAIVLMQLLEISLLYGLSESEETFVMTNFGSTTHTMFVLAMCVTGGMDWGDMAIPLGEVSQVHQTIFTSYIAVAVLGVLNIVTGIFVESATKNVQMDASHMMMLEITSRLKWMEGLANAFEDADMDNNGRVSLRELKRYIGSANVRACLRGLGLDVNADNVDCLFHAVDFDGDGYLTLTEFIDGCAHVAGNARQLELYRVRARTEEIYRLVEQLARTEEGNANASTLA
eukprot:NODE_207_length_1806_cov_659.147915.p1 GENE.NODE_207_length_1806_cov_659.147915~~NODE_207_length_1806_cov_659.147915.p1  ORF type:complete len:539 (-),score=116.84 NODE_207_length_1806_cov_659.147915:114-1730(-)